MERDTSMIIYIICGSSWQLKRISNYKLEKGSSLTFLDFDAEDLTEKIASLKNSFFCLVPAGFFPNKKARDFMAKTAFNNCLLYTSPSPRDVEESRMPSSA